MPTYAILGATGFTGRCLVSQLSSVENTTLNLYARSKDKLLLQNPSFENLPENVKLFIGPLSDQDLITSCIRGVDAVFCVLATNDSTPGCHVAQDQAQIVLNAMKDLKSAASGSDSAKLPKSIVLSAVPVSTVFKSHLPTPVRWMLWRVLGSLYRDLELAEALLRKEKDWLRATFVYPGGLSNVGDERCFGHKVIVESDEAGGGGFMSYGDLAAGMVDVAKELTGKYDWVDVSVVQTGESGKMEWGTFARLMIGGLVFGG